LLMSRLNYSVRIFLCPHVIVMKINYAIPCEGCSICKQNWRNKERVQCTLMHKPLAEVSLAGKSAGPRPWTLCKWYGYSSYRCRTLQTVMCDTAAILLVLLAGTCSVWCRIFSSKLGVWTDNGLPQFAITGWNVPVSRKRRSVLTNVCLSGRCCWG
jgi:hypothetical protein